MAFGVDNQLELFDSSKEGFSKTKRFDIRRNPALEKNIILAISYSLVAIIFFSIGVEKGKRLNGPTMNMRVDLPAPDKVNSKTLNVYQAKPVIENVVKSAVVEEIKPNVSGYSAKFTIQLASFSNNQNAEIERERLSRKGYNVFTVNTGKHYIVCFGNFKTFDEAANSKEFKSMKKIYSDCFINRI